MIVLPKCCNVKLSCIKCGCAINAHKDYEDSAVNVGVWHQSTVATAFSSIKSELSGCAFIIAVCDDCLKLSVADGHTVQFYNTLKNQEEIIEQPKQYLEIDLEFQPEDD